MTAMPPLPPMGQQPAALNVPVQPVPQQVGVQIVHTPQGNAVVIQISGPTGVHVTFMTPEAAQKIGGDIRKAGKQAASGLVLPPGAVLDTDDLPSNGHGDLAP